jgi:co-chaperonin GroES (HSP10)
MAFTPAINNVVLSIYPKYIGNYSNIIKAANLNPGSQLNPADLVNVVGEVVAVPKEISQGKFAFPGFTTKDIEVGDTALLRFDVVFDMVEQEFSDVPLYRNLVWYKGKEYWVASIDKVYAVIKKESKSIKMLNGYVMLEDLEPEQRIYMPQYSKRISRAKEATLAQIGNTKAGETKIEAFPGDRVLVHPYRLTHYQVNGKKYSITEARHIMGRVLN